MPGSPGWPPVAGHLDATSFHVDERYNSQEEDTGFDKQAAGVIRVSKGYSRDHREDLNQVVLELITDSQTNLPMTMCPLSGNASDKVSFKDAIERHIGQLKADDGSGGPNMVVIDSAGFSQESLQACQRQGLRWVMRVPATIAEAKRCLEEVDPDKLRPLAEGYRYSTFTTTYAAVKQRWLVIYSEAARERVAKQVDKELLKQSDKERKAFDELCRKEFTAVLTRVDPRSCTHSA